MMWRTRISCLARVVVVVVLAALLFNMEGGHSRTSAANTTY
jgi:hypothetical protein